MTTAEETLARLLEIPALQVLQDVPLSAYTRFGIGGPADIFAETADEAAFAAAVDLVRQSDIPRVVIGSGTNLIVSDSGCRGVVLRYSGQKIMVSRRMILVDAGLPLQTLVNESIDHSLQGLHTLTGIPGSVGAAIYGNAGAYGHSIAESIQSVRFYDGTRVRVLDTSACEFQYRESIFKTEKDWTIFSAVLQLELGNAEELRANADGILTIRNKKYPPTMKCAGSIFKNFLLADLPASVQERVPARAVIEGKVPSAYFLEEVGAKGLRNGAICVADYHANLIYNEGGGTARALREVIENLKHRVRVEFGIELEEEVQYIGF